VGTLLTEAKNNTTKLFFSSSLHVSSFFTKELTFSVAISTVF